MVLILASSGCAELPPDSGSVWSGAASSPTEAPVEEDPDPGYLTSVTPYPTPTSDMARPTLSRPPEAAPIPDTYVTIYDETIQYPQATKAFALDLTTPPLIIEFEVEPKMVTRIKRAKSDYGKREYKDYKQTFPSESAWFLVTIRDRGTGSIVAQNGFGKLYSADAKGKIFIGRSGDYQIELAGGDAKVRVLMRAGGV